MDAKRASNPVSHGHHQPLGVNTLLPFLVIAATVAVYTNSFDGAFVFDEKRDIIHNASIHHLWPPWEVLSGRRPVVDLTLAFNFALGGVKVEGYHAVNLAVHVIAALTLYGIIRRTLLRKRFRDRFGRASSHLALTVAVIWAVHPLQTQSVTYVIQRAESLMGLFYLLTLYCVIRGADSSRHIKWYAAAIVFCALGMGSKAVMVTAPVMVLLYDRVFLSESSVETFRRRWGLYLCLAATWCVLWVCGLAQGVLSTSRKVATVGFSFKDITPPEYALTQFGVLVKYLNLSFWPYPLCLDYAWPVARTVGVVVVPAIIIVALFVAVVWALIRGRWWGFVGAWFFVILAPTSSFIPIKDTFFEHRMYLPLAAVVASAVFGSNVALRLLIERLESSRLRSKYITAGLVLLAVALLGYGTVRRNGDYRTAVSMWRDIAVRRPESERAHVNLGTVLLADRRIDEAVIAYRRAVLLSPDDARARCNLGVALTKQDRLDEAMDTFRQALKIEPRMADAHYNLGLALIKEGSLQEAARSFREAVRLTPRDADAHYDLGRVLVGLGRLDEALTEFQQTLAIIPDHSGARRALAVLRGNHMDVNGD